MSASTNPFEQIERFFERMGEQFDDAATSWDTGDLGRLPGFESTAVDLVEHDDQFVVTADLPGFERDDVSVQVTDQTLRIEAEHAEATEESDEETDGRYLRRERRRESVHRSVHLPKDVDKEGVTARMHHGVLTVTLPKAEVEQAREIEIEVS